jgi:hypothetical protein
MSPRPNDSDAIPLHPKNDALEASNSLAYIQTCMIELAISYSSGSSTFKTTTAINIQTPSHMGTADRASGTRRTCRHGKFTHTQVAYAFESLQILSGYELDLRQSTSKKGTVRGVKQYSKRK